PKRSASKPKPQPWSRTLPRRRLRSVKRRAVRLTVSRRTAPPSSLTKRKPRLPLIFATGGDSERDPGGGIEPTFARPERAVLPLDERGRGRREEGRQASASSHSHIRWPRTHVTGQFRPVPRLNFRPIGDGYLRGAPRLFTGPPVVAFQPRREEPDEEYP